MVMTSPATAPTPQRPEAGPVMLDIRNVRQTYSKGQANDLLVLDGINFQLREGEIVGLLGNGAAFSAPAASATLADVSAAGCLRRQSSVLRGHPMRTLRPLIVQAWIPICGLQSFS